MATAMEDETRSSLAEQKKASKTVSKIGHVGKYEILEKLGEGSFGKVMKGMDKKTGKMVALKFIEMKNDKAISLIERETNIMNLLIHPNIVRYYEKVNVPELNSVCLVMELIEGGELFDYIVARGKVNEVEAIRFFRQILSALQYCHYHGVVHRDLKPENILLDNDQNVKVMDFGLARLMTGSIMHTNCGSPIYSAPEILNAMDYKGPEVDTWSIGCILYVMVTGLCPWPGRNLSEQLKYACVGHYVPPKNVSPELSNLFSYIFTMDPTKRPTITQLMEHPWVNRGQDELIPYELKVDSNIPIVIDDHAVEELVKLGFNKEAIKVALNTHQQSSPLFVLYHLFISSSKQIKEEYEEDLRKSEDRLRLSQQSNNNNNSGNLNNSNRLKDSSDDNNNRLSSSTELKTGERRDSLGSSSDNLLNKERRSSVDRNSSTSSTSTNSTGQRKLSMSGKDNSPSILRFIWGSKSQSQKPLLQADASSGIMSMLKGLGVQTPTPNSQSQLKISQEFSVSDLQKIRSSSNSIPNFKSNTPKVVKKTFVLQKLTNIPLDEIEIEVERAIKHLGYGYKKEGIRFHIKDEDSQYSDDLKVHLEICKVEKEQGMGICFKRHRGNVFHYKEVIQKLEEEMKL